MDTLFSRTQIVFLLLLALGISNHVLILPHLLQKAGRDAWLSVIIGYGVLVLWSMLLYRVLKSMRGQSLKSWLNGRGGAISYGLIGGSVLLYFLLAGAIIIYDTTKNVTIYFLPRTPSTITILSFVLLTYWAAQAGLKTLVYMAALLLPLVWLLGMGVAIFTMDSKDYGLLQPVLAEGWSAPMAGSMIAVGGSFDLLVLLLLQHRMNKPIHYAMLLVVITLLAGLILGPTVGAIAAFGPVQAGNLRFPPFEQWRLVMIGHYISHVDFLAAFQLMAGSVVRAGLCLHVLVEALELRKPAMKQAVLITVLFLMALPALLEVSDITIQSWLHQYYYKSSLIWGAVVTATLFAASYVRGRREVKRDG
ncbi:endospore germination permease [Paenibacillus sp. PL2-23]|uniref:GerAB/ArcD/ProY family transporter n=1 Tax=Paenibacillus sp. PL2-23 TaxID=2100729 RepID=UPI0030F98040